MKYLRLTKEVDGVEASSLVLYYVELPSRNLCVVEEVYTALEYRYQGYATELIKQAIEQAKEWGADCIELTVRQDSPHIQEFYKRHGFVDRKNISMRLPLKDIKPWNP